MKKQLLWPAVIVWLASIGGAFWILYFDDLRAFDSNAPYTDSQLLVREKALLIVLSNLGVNTQAEAPQYVHILSDTCHCFQYATKYLSSVLQKPESLTESHWILAPASALNKISVPLNMQPRVLNISPIVRTELAALLPTAPALLIVKQGKLMYIGPHSAGINCGEGVSFIQLYQNNLAAGFEAPLFNLEQTGCFCHL